MKKILTTLLIIFSVNCFGQKADTVNVSLTLRAQDWAWLLGKYGAGQDSISRVRVRALRTAMLAANPATWTTNVTINNVNGTIIIWMYATFQSTGFGEIINMGANTAERTTIYTNIRNINNSAIQYFIGLIDGNRASDFTNNRNQGKSILLDN